MYFFYNDTATTEIYTLSLHDALPIYEAFVSQLPAESGFYSTMPDGSFSITGATANRANQLALRSEEHTSELQSRLHLVCRLLLEKKKKNIDAEAAQPVL